MSIGKNSPSKSLISNLHPVSDRWRFALALASTALLLRKQRIVAQASKPTPSSLDRGKDTRFQFLEGDRIILTTFNFMSVEKSSVFRLRQPPLSFPSRVKTLYFRPGFAPQNNRPTRPQPSQNTFELSPTPTQPSIWVKVTSSHLHCQGCPNNGLHVHVPWQIW